MMLPEWEDPFIVRMSILPQSNLNPNRKFHDKEILKFIWKRKCTRTAGTFLIKDSKRKFVLLVIEKNSPNNNDGIDRPYRQSTEP